jgi:tetratricopeptide (TPR) repeat protein
VTRKAILLFNWATTLYEQNALEEAVATYQRSLDLDPTSGAARYALAASYIAISDEAVQAGDIGARLSNLRSADAELTRALAYNPDFPEARRALDRVKAVCKEIENALEAADKTTQL